MFTDGDREIDAEEAGGGSRVVENGTASDEEGRGDITGDEGIDGDGAREGEPGHDACLSAERSMTGICVCCSLTLEDIALDSNTDIIIDLLTFLSEHKNIYMLSGLISLGDLRHSPVMSILRNFTVVTSLPPMRSSKHD
jgi:hypothetical protein